MKRICVVPITAVMAIDPASADSAHSDHCAAVAESVAEPGFGDSVTAT